MRPRELKRASRLPVGLLLAVVAVALIASPAIAHADLESTVPEDGTVVEEPLLHVEIHFTNDVEPVNSGIRVLDDTASGIPFTLSQPEPTAIVLAFDEPIESGLVVVFWEARSSDGHGLEGSFRISVAPPGTEDATTSTSAPLEETTSTTVASSQATTTTTVATQTVDSIDAGAGPANDEGWMGLTAAGRWLVIMGAVIAIGAASFAAGALVGSRSEVGRTVRWMNLGGLLVVAGTLVEIAGVGLAAGTSLLGAFALDQVSSGFTTSHQFTIALRLVGAIAIMQSPNLASATPAGSAATLPAKPADHGDGSVAVAATGQQYRLGLATEWLALAGLVALALSFAFDGHSSAAGTIARLASVAHVAAAGVWAGGLIVMADMLIRRHASSTDLGATATALRFSRLASIAIVVVGLAGIALSVSIVEEMSDLFSTTWGRLLIAKTGLVAIAATIGAFNHFKVVPDVGSGHPEAASKLRRTVTTEAGIILLVTVVTAVLAGSAI